jgi:hypothetical protein
MFPKHVEAQITQTSRRAKAEFICLLLQSTIDPAPIDSKTVGTHRASNIFPWVADDGVGGSAHPDSARHDMAIQHDRRSWKRPQNLKLEARR